MNFKIKRSFTLFFTAFACLAVFSGCGKARPYTGVTLSDVPPQAAQAAVMPDFSSYIKEVSFLGCGDNIIYKGNVKEAASNAKAGGRTYNFKPTYALVADRIEKADIAFINQETVMAGDGYELSYYPMFNSPQDVGYDLQELGFDVVGIANNHMLDKGAKGLEKTIAFWKNMEGVLLIGGYDSREDYDTVRVLEKNGIKIAFLAYTYGTNGLTKAASSPVVIPYINEDDITRQVAAAKNAADAVIISVHWGDEGSFKPNDAQKRTAQLLADCGVTAIIGHHPHVIQPVEWITGKNGNKTLCVYSLGNFAAEQAYDYNMVGGMISFDLVQIANTEPHLENVVFTPTVFHFNASFTSNRIYPMDEYTPALAAAHGVRAAYKHAFDYDRLVKYAKDTISDEFLPETMKEEQKHDAA